MGALVLMLGLAWVSWPLFSFMLVWSVSVSVVLYRMSQRLQAYEYQATEARHSLLGKISDNLTNIFSVLFFANRHHELKTLQQRIRDIWIPRQLEAYRYDFRLSWMAALWYWGMLFIVFFFMIFLRQTGQISTGALVFVMGVTLALADKLWLAVRALQNFMREWGDFRSSVSLLDQEESVSEKNLARALQVTRGVLHFEQVTFSYQPEKKVLKDFSLLIQGGEKCGLVGLSGAGKSTVVSLLLKNFEPQGGRIQIDHQDLKACDPDSVRRQIAFIPQEALLFHRTLLENIRYGRLDATDKEVYQAAQRARLHDFILTLPDQYESLVGERGLKLSGGQRQRLAIARAFLKQAPILVLDEATASLDTQIEREIQDSIQQTLQESRCTVIAIAHRLSTLKHLDRICVLEGGQIREEGSHESLLGITSGRYQQLWKMQQ